MAQKLWREEFKVHSYEVGPSGFVTPQSICRFLQEVASNHADTLGVAGEVLEKAGQMWVLSQLSYHLPSYPKWHQRIVIETWPVRKEPIGIRGQRDFRILSESGHELGTASSIWLLLNQETRRPLRIPEELKQFGSEPLAKEVLNPIKESDIAGGAAHTIDFRIRGSEIDWNMHVNNVCYVEWALETIDPQFRIKNKLERLDISFLNEGLYGNEVEAQRFDTDNSNIFLHKITDSGSNKTLSVLRTNWSAK